MQKRRGHCFACLSFQWENQDHNDAPEMGGEVKAIWTELNWYPASSSRVEMSNISNMLLMFYVLDFRWLLPQKTSASRPFRTSYHTITRLLSTPRNREKPLCQKYISENSSPVGQKCRTLLGFAACVSCEKPPLLVPWHTSFAETITMLKNMDKHNHKQQKSLSERVHKSKKIIRVWILGFLLHVAWKRRRNDFLQRKENLLTHRPSEGARYMLAAIPKHLASTEEARDHFSALSERPQDFRPVGHFYVPST